MVCIVMDTANVMFLTGTSCCDYSNADSVMKE